MLFGIAIDWVMRKCTNNTNRGIHWVDKVLEDLDFADNLVLLSSTHPDAQEKINNLQNVSGQIGLQINTTKTKTIDLTNSSEDTKLSNHVLEKVNSFTYLGSKMTSTGGLYHQKYYLESHWHLVPSINCQTSGSQSHSANIRNLKSSILV